MKKLTIYTTNNPLKVEAFLMDYTGNNGTLVIKGESESKQVIEGKLLDHIKAFLNDGKEV